MTGQKFGSRTVIKYAGQYRNTTRSAWLCRCECGRESIVDGSNLRGGLARACLWCRKGRLTHGLSKSPIYAIWFGMRARCSNPKNTHYHRYGGRGIQVCERWKKFENFVADMGMPPRGKTVERINNDGNYEPSNCRWASRKEQANNTRRNTFIQTSQGKLSLREIASRAGITYEAVQERRRRGWAGDQLLAKKSSRLSMIS